MDTKDFLNLFHTDNKIHFRVIRENAKNLYGTYDELKNTLQSYNDNGYNIYFVVNSGGTYSHEISNITSLFVDFDCGKDKNKQYYSLDYVNNYKQECLAKINKFELKPSLIVETRNGLHIYWLIDNMTKEQFLDYQLRLIDYFNSDPAVKTLERVMRVPGFNWIKDINNPFMCKVLKYNNVKYNVGDFMNKLPELEIKQSININDNKLVKPTTNNNIQLIRNLDINNMRRKVSSIEYIKELYSIDDTKTPSTIVGNRSQLYDTISRIDLIEFLGLDNSNFNCIFHDDNSHSASIFVNSENGHYLYKCHSSNCSFPTGTIIRVVERLAKCSKSKAINFIKDVYNIELVESEWQIRQKEMLQQNKDYLYSGLMETEFPTLYKRIKNYIPLLILINDLAMNYVYDENLSNDDDKVIFFAGMRHIASIAQLNSTRRLNDRINLFAFLELLDKLDEKDIPIDMLKRTKSEAAKKKQVYLTNYYGIQSYSDEVLGNAQDNAILFENKNMTIRGWSRELLLRNFGDEVADKVFPQFKGKELTKSSENFANKFIKIVLELIDNYGYCTENQVLSMLTGYKDLNKTRLKRVLQETLEKYNLNRIRANKQIKENYGITTNGYPFIIVKNQVGDNY